MIKYPENLTTEEKLSWLEIQHETLDIQFKGLSQQLSHYKKERDNWQLNYQKMLDIKNELRSLILDITGQFQDGRTF